MSISGYSANGNKEIGIMVLLVFLAICPAFRAAAQQNNTKTSIVFGGYRSGAVDSRRIGELNAFLETSVTNRDTLPFIQFHTVDPEELNRILYELEQPDTSKRHDFDFTLFGDIVRNDNGYSVKTQLIHQTTTQIIPFFETGVADSDLESVVKRHGQEIVAVIRDMHTQMEVTFSAILKAEEAGEYELALRWIWIYKIRKGNTTDLELAELRIQQKAGRIPPPPSVFDLIDTISRAGNAIETAFDNSLPVSKRERSYNDSKRLLAVIDLDPAVAAPDYEPRIVRIRERIAEYERVHISDDLYTGGIEAAFNQPVLFRDIFGMDYLDYYPHISAVSLNWLIPVDSPAFQPYLKLNYLGFLNHAAQKVEYLDDAAVYGISLTAGVQWQWQIKKLFFPYVFVGGGYCHYLEWVKDSDSSATANYGAVLYEGGAGLRIHVTPNIAVFGNIGINFNNGQPFAFSINYSAGVSYFFYGKTSSYSY
jgi:hypothetical protein